METGIVKLTPELLAIFAGNENSNSLLPFSREIFLLDIVVAGTTYCENLNEVLPKLDADAVLKMVRDPKNEHDECAIAIYFDGVRIGWVPRDLNQVVARLMDAGKMFFARVHKISDVYGWTKIDAKIYMVE